MAAEEPRVLAISEDRFALIELRVNNPLRSLQRQQLIQGFTTTGAAMEKLECDSSCYDVILVQRMVPEAIYLALAAMGIPFVLDIDDNVLARAAYRSDAPESPVRVGLRCATVVTATTARLIALLEKYSGLRLSSKAQLVPNGLPYPSAIIPPAKPARLLWIQSDIAALKSSRAEVVRAVEDFSSRHQLPVILVGRNVLDRPQFSRQVVMGEVDFTGNLQLLEFGGTGIGVAPLETQADEETLDFVAGKSDLKILLFDGYGHPGVYSNSAPYDDSPLRAGIRITPNTYRGWSDALQYQYQAGWQRAEETSRRICQERHIDRIARECWLPALAKVRIPNPISAKELFHELNRFGILSETQRLKRELQEFRNSLSWKITAPLRRVAKPFWESKQNRSSKG